MSGGKIIDFYSFEKKLYCAPVLALPDFTKAFEIECEVGSETY